MNLPIEFEDRMRRLLGSEYEEYLQCYERPHYSGIRVNTLKITPEEFEKLCPFTITRIPWIHNGYYYNSEEQPSKHPYYYAGLYYIQEPSAMTPASLLPIHPDDKVLDICAAPGGKSTELGARLSGSGVLVSNDISNSRAKALLKNIELFGIRNSLILSEAPNKLAEYFPEYFDKILIDAPCSGEGMFRKSPAIMKNWEQYGVEYYNKLQKEIILFAAKMLKPGGYLLYSTCTFSPEENEGTISYLMEQFPEFHVVNALPDIETQKKLGISYEGFDTGKPEWLNSMTAARTERLNSLTEGRSELVDDFDTDKPNPVDRKEELRSCIRLWPHKIKGEGHFAALLHKEVKDDIKVKEYANVKAENNFSNELRYSTGNAAWKNKSNISEEAFDFIKTLRIPWRQEQLMVHGDSLYLLPEGLPELKGLRILRQGLLLGEMKKQRFEPSQALANALHPKDYDKIISLHVDDPNVIRYLKCEAIEPEGVYADGWYLVCVEDYPLGWMKVANNNFKNKYLPGWRWV